MKWNVDLNLFSIVSNYYLPANNSQEQILLIHIKLGKIPLKV